jgi:hypothetical protein
MFTIWADKLCTIMCYVHDSDYSGSFWQDLDIGGEGGANLIWGFHGDKS